jgi:hypothetical protein
VRVLAQLLVDTTQEKKLRRAGKDGEAISLVLTVSLLV